MISLQTCGLNETGLSLTLWNLIKDSLRWEVFRFVCVQIMFSWVVTPCSLIWCILVYQRKVSHLWCSKWVEWGCRQVTDSLPTLPACCVPCVVSVSCQQHWHSQNNLFYLFSPCNGIWNNFLGVGEYFILEQKMFTTQNTVVKIMVVLPLEIHVMVCRRD